MKIQIPKKTFVFRNYIKKPLQLLSLVAYATAFSTAQASSVYNAGSFVNAGPHYDDGTLLEITHGHVANNECISGSCVGYPNFSDPSIIVWRPLIPGSDKGIIIGNDQTGGSNQPDQIAFANPFVLGGRGRLSLSTSPQTGTSFGQVLTGSEQNSFAKNSCSGPCIPAQNVGNTTIGTMTLVFGDEVHKFGSFGDTLLGNVGGYDLDWQIINGGESYVLDYTNIALKNDGSRSFLGGKRLYLHLEGRIIPPGGVEGIVFSDQSTNSNITHEDLTSADTIGGGIAWIDADNDGRPDLFIPSGIPGTPGLFYYNNPDHSFTEMADQAGLTSTAGNGNGVAVGDYDGDGCDDIFIANGKHQLLAPEIGGRVNTLYRNNFCDTGSISFTNVTVNANLVNDLSAFSDRSASAVASFGDVNGDGYLDLYVGNYVVLGRIDLAISVSDLLSIDFCSSNQFYLNNGDGTFTEMARTLGIQDTGCTLATTLTDYDQDGDLDIYVVNDFSSTDAQRSPSFANANLSWPDTIYENTGNVNGIPQFSPATSINLSNSPNGMSIAVGDYDNDLDLDYFSTSFLASLISNFTATNVSMLNQNQGDNTFLNQSVTAGVAGNSPLLSDPNISPFDVYGGAWVGWGSAFFDVDNDGYLDLYKANGSVQGASFGSHNFNQPNHLYHNNKNGTFDEIAGVAGVDGVLCDAVTVPCISTTSGNIPFTNQSRGVAVADFDQDGDMDIVVRNLASLAVLTPGANESLLEPGRTKLYRNDSNSIASNNYVRIELQGLNPNHRGIGAKIFLTTADGNQQMREINAGTSHGSTHEFTAHFGIGANASVNSLRVEWLSGCTQQLNFVGTNETTKIFESNCAKTGNGTFRGRVIDSDTGKGIPAATVIAFGSEIKFASADNNGFYALENVLPGSYGILVIPPNGYLTTQGSSTFKTCDSGTKRVLPAGTTLVENCTLDPKATLTLSGGVTDSSGNNLAGVEVKALNGNTTTTRLNGTFSLRVEDGEIFVSLKSSEFTFTPRVIFMNGQDQFRTNFTANP